jgi:Holliday junction resolvase-like predicted endonuclease
MKSALHKAQTEAQEEIKRQAESYLRQQREQKEVISKLQVIPFFN